VEFKAPAGKRLLGIRTGSLYGSSEQGLVCTQSTEHHEQATWPPQWAGASSPDANTPGRPATVHATTRYPKTGFRKGFATGPDTTPMTRPQWQLQAINPISIARGVEFGGTIRKFGKKYYWTVLCEGSPNCTGMPSTQDPGVWHTHGSPYTGPDGQAMAKGFSDDPGVPATSTT